MNLPRRRKSERMGIREESAWIREPKHRQWVRRFECAAAKADGKNCSGDMEFAHVRCGTDGCTGVKPSDCWGIPLCYYHHEIVQHNIGEPEFERRFDIKMKVIALQLWLKSPHRFDWMEHPGFINYRNR